MLISIVKCFPKTGLQNRVNQKTGNIGLKGF